MFFEPFPSIKRWWKSIISRNIVGLIVGGTDLEKNPYTGSFIHRSLLNRNLTFSSHPIILIISTKRGRPNKFWRKKILRLFFSIYISHWILYLKFTQAIESLQSVSKIYFVNSCFQESDARQQKKYTNLSKNLLRPFGGKNSKVCESLSLPSLSIVISCKLNVSLKSTFFIFICCGKNVDVSSSSLLQIVLK